MILFTIFLDSTNLYSFIILLLFEYSIQWYQLSIYDSTININNTMNRYYQHRYWYQKSFQILHSNWYMKAILIVSFIKNITHNNHLFYQFLIYTLLARIGETSIHSFIFIKILVIDLDWTFLNELGRSTVWRLGISIHHSIIQYQTRKGHYIRIYETTPIRSDGC